MGLEAAAVKALSSAGVRPGIEALKRQERVIALLKKLNLSPEAPPSDFNGVYVHALVQHCYGMPETIVELFRNKHVKQAFRTYFETGDRDELQTELATASEILINDGALEGVDYDPRLQLPAFESTFQRLVDLTRTAAHARTDLKIEYFGQNIQAEMLSLRQYLEGAAGQQALRNATPLEPESAVQGLMSQVKGWFEANDYRIERELQVRPDYFAWIINVPARRGYDRIIVAGVAGEASAENARSTLDLVSHEHCEEGWLVASRRVSAAAAIVAEDSRKLLSTFTVDTLIDQDVDFSPYLDWLDAEVRTKKIDTNFVPLGCRKEEIDSQGGPVTVSAYRHDEGGLSDYVDLWVADTSKEHLSVLGEFGTGKSWFCLRYAWVCAQRYRAAVSRGVPRPRIPLVIPLRDYAKAVSIESLFSEFFFRKHQIPIRGYSAFEYLNRSGKLLLIFDGFDEMASRIDRQSRINNFWELARAVSGDAKVLLTCRTEHFPEALESRQLLSAKLKASTMDLSGEPPQFEVVDLLPFEDEQVRKLLCNVTDDATAEIVMSHSALLDLLRRPVMSELLLDALPDIKRGKSIDLARIYLYAVRRKMVRDIHAERTFTSLKDKMFFLAEISWEMLSKSAMSLNYRDFPDRIRSVFRQSIMNERDLDHWHHDMMGQSMLIRNAQGDYTPAHRSLTEFFVAYKLAAMLGSMNPDFEDIFNDEGGVAGTVVDVRWTALLTESLDLVNSPIRFVQDDLEHLANFLGKVVLDDALLGLAIPMLDIPRALEVLYELILSTRGDSSRAPGGLGGVCAQLMVSLDKDALVGRDLSQSNIAGARFFRRNPPFISLAGTDLSGCDVGAVDFENTCLQNAILVGANVEESVDLGRTWQSLDVVSDQIERYIIGSNRLGQLICWEDGNFADAVPLVDLGHQVFVIEAISPTTLLVQVDGPSSYVIVNLQERRLVSGSKGRVFWSVLNQQGWEGVLALEASDDFSAKPSLTAVGLDGVRSQSVDIDDDLRLSTFDQALGLTLFLTQQGVLFTVNLEGSVLTIAKRWSIDVPTIVYSNPNDSTADQDQLRLEYFSENEIDVSRGYIFVRFAERNVAVCRVADGSLTAVLELSEEVNSREYRRHPWSGFDAISCTRFFIVRVRSLVEVFDSSSGESLWKLKSAVPLSSMCLSRGNGELIITDSCGGVEVRRVEDGSVSRRMSVASDWSGLLVDGSALDSERGWRLLQGGALCESSSHASSASRQV